MLGVAEDGGELLVLSVVVLRNTAPLGYGENFLRAARRATGDCIALCDQDDVWLPTELEAALAALAGTAPSCTSTERP